MCWEKKRKEPPHGHTQREREREIYIYIYIYVGTYNRYYMDIWYRNCTLLLQRFVLPWSFGLHYLPIYLFTATYLSICLPISIVLGSIHRSYLSISISAVEFKKTPIYIYIYYKPIFYPSSFFSLTGISNAMQLLGRACNWDYWDYLHFSTHFFCFPLPCWITTVGILWFQLAWNDMLLSCDMEWHSTLRPTSQHHFFNRKTFRESGGKPSNARTLLKALKRPQTLRGI